MSGSGTLTYAGSNTFSGGTTISSGTLQVNTGGALGSGNVTDNASLVFNTSGSLNVGVVISGTGSLVQQGSGTVMLTANNTYSGTTTISAGVLQIGNSTTNGTLGNTHLDVATCVEGFL